LIARAREGVQRRGKTESRVAASERRRHVASGRRDDQRAAVRGVVVDPQLMHTMRHLGQPHDSRNRPA